MPLFLASSQHCALREDSAGHFVFLDAATPTAQASGSWQEVVMLATRILVHEARENGGIPGAVFGAAEAHAIGIQTGTIREYNEDYAQELLALIQQLKAM